MEQGWSSGMFDMKDEDSDKLLEKAREIKKRCGGCIGKDCLVNQYITDRESQNREQTT